MVAGGLWRSSRAGPTLVAYSPLLQGLYDAPAAERARVVAEGGYTAGSAPGSARDRLAALDAVAADIGASPGQVVLAWLAARRSPSTIPLIGTTKVERYREAAVALDLRLTPEHLARLDGPSGTGDQGSSMHVQGRRARSRNA